MSTKHTGFNKAMEAASQDGTEWQKKLGSILPDCIVRWTEEAREEHYPIGELQYGVEDFQDCASRGPINDLESKFTYLLRKKLLKAWTEDFLRKNGYIVVRNGLEWVEFSDRFVAINSNTTREGNSLKAPIDAIRTYGLIPKSKLPKKEDMTWEQYHNKNDITSEMYALGREFAVIFPIKYYKVKRDEFDDVLEKDGLVAAGYAWPTPQNGEYGYTPADFNHAFYVSRRKYKAYDNYKDVDGDFIKKLTPDYNFMDYAYRVVITGQITPEEQKKTISILQLIVDLLLKAIGLKVKIDEQAKETNMPEKPTQPKSNLIEKWADFAEKHEGYGTPNAVTITKNFNPGALRWSPFQIASRNGFAVFKDYASGRKALIHQLTIACNGKSKVYNPEMDLYDFYEVYAPRSDKNDPIAYANAAIKYLGIPPRAKIKTFLS